MLNTPRLSLIPATLPLARAEVADREEFARFLDARVPDNWPPETLAEALPLFLKEFEAAPDAVGWFGWYAIASNEATLAGSIGFRGPPQNGEVEVGYSVLPQFQRRGYATEMVAALVHWALGQPGVERVAAETDEGNIASCRVLGKTGFARVGVGNEPGSLRFVILARAPE
ncbi:MAG TPA: GNAT family N-acetyltransferase [Gemmata sp.]|nr:GNAT family N-acetyltransferase [Gemmata sp.]